MDVFVGVYNFFSCSVLQGFSDVCIGFITISHTKIFCAFAGCNWEESSWVCVNLPWCVRYFYVCKCQISYLYSFVYFCLFWILFIYGIFWRNISSHLVYVSFFCCHIIWETFVYNFYSKSRPRSEKSFLNCPDPC